MMIWKLLIVEILGKFLRSYVFVFFLKVCDIFIFGCIFNLLVYFKMVSMEYIYDVILFIFMFLIFYIILNGINEN